MQSAQSGVDDSSVDYGSTAVEFGWNELMDSDQPHDLSSNRLPSYLKIGGRNSAMERNMKMKLLDCPITSMRKPTEIMEQDLVQIRHSLSEEKRAKLKQTRAMRRLNRRCRVKDGEDIDALEKQYLGEESDAVLEDPGVREHKPGVSSKDYFAKLKAVRPQVFSARSDI